MCSEGVQFNFWRSVSNNIKVSRSALHLFIRYAVKTVAMTFVHYHKLQCAHITQMVLISLGHSAIETNQIVSSAAIISAWQPDRALFQESVYLANPLLGSHFPV